MSNTSYIDKKYLRFHDVYCTENVIFYNIRKLVIWMFILKEIKTVIELLKILYRQIKFIVIYLPIYIDT
ncbi:hypothetical protein AKH13_15435 [Vibrio parahaemolyticus]|nr:hypothetical protein [Vibrio parahaemolyticus]OCP76759.1 hypothetical protein AKH11_23825 [Vibrio parahaemolyticus]OCP89471.1 hypothetical protein AKH13_15435 [Vibrio parahaemolyticus]OCP93444.1 hypothetical protein AKH14_23920 [Vibrio parahaemolyticus]